MEALRVFFDLRPLQSPSGKRGIGTYIRGLLGAIRGVDWIFLAWKNRPFPQGVPQAPVVTVPPPPWWMLGWLWDRFLLTRLDSEADLAHFSSPFELDLGWPSRGFRRPCVVTVHDLNLVVHREHTLRGRYRVLAPIYAWIGRELARADYLLANSFHTAQEVGRFLAPTPPIQVTPLAPSPNFRPQSARDQRAFRRTYRLPEDYLLYVGGLDHRKNLELLLRALHHQSWPLVIAGGAASAADRSRLKDLTKGLEITFLEHLPERELVLLYSSARALVFPSFCEGFGLPVLEAMACATPVVCSDRTALPEVGGQAALYFDPGSVASLIRALGQLPSQQPRLRKLGLERVSHFDWDRTAQLTLETYSRVIKDTALE